MGSTDSAPSPTLAHFSRRFIITPHPLDPQQSTLLQLHEKLTNSKYILRVLSTNDED